MITPVPTRPCRRLATLAALVLIGAAGPAGCNTAGEGALSGGAIGALSGLAIGSLTGDAGAGAAIGAIAGAVGGGIIGDHNRRKAEAQANPRPSPPPTQYPAAAPLARFVGDWRVEGWCLGENGAQMKVTGTARGVVDKTYFMRLDLNLNDPRSGQPIQGTSVIGQLGGNRLEMTNAFSTSPETKRFDGEMDSSGSLFSFTQVSPAGVDRKVSIRVESDSRWTADAWEQRSSGPTRVESFTFQK